MKANDAIGVGTLTLVSDPLNKPTPGNGCTKRQSEQLSGSDHSLPRFAPVAIVKSVWRGRELSMGLDSCGLCSARCDHAIRVCLADVLMCICLVAVRSSVILKVASHAVIL